jgi:CDP-paratose 2-epimerase
MAVALITGSNGLIGSESARYFGQIGLHVAGIDNDMRKVFFGEHASTRWMRTCLETELPASYEHHDLDIRDRDGVDRCFRRYGTSVSLVIHAAGQPSHDWAATDPRTDFDVNAFGTLNLLESARRYCPEAVFIFTSTNKVYGDTPNRLPLNELETRWELDGGHTYFSGIREDMSVDRCLHSLFGVSKLAADVMVQEYGRYFGMRTACFRGGTLTGPHHAATQLHGFLAYLVKCAMTGEAYTIHGYKGKQVRDAIHSTDVVAAFDAVYRSPRIGEVYNIGGGRRNNVSVLEAIQLVEEVTGTRLSYTYSDANRIGDHIWWIGDNGLFESHYPEWRQRYTVRETVAEIFQRNLDRWGSESLPITA